MSRKPRPAIPGQASSDTEAMIRVDHAGEYGAVRIYQGQLAALRLRGAGAESLAAIAHMAEEEKRHLARFDELVRARKVRPTILSPVWHMAGFALGAATAMLGEKAAMACTAAVEEAIDDHYGAQLERLDADPELKSTVEDFRADEAAHRQAALDHGAEEAPAYRLLSATIKAGCRVAIRLSEKF